MAVLSASQLQVITTLIDSAPDSAIRSLDMALASEAGTEGPMALIRDMVSSEAGERRARRMTFAPLAGLCGSSGSDGSSKALPGQTLALLWRALKTDLPDQVSLAVATSLHADEEEGAEVYDALCAAAATGLRKPEGTSYAGAATALEKSAPGAAAEVANFLDLAPLSREAMSKLTDWVSRMTDERAAAIRLAYRDASAISQDAGPRLLEVLASRLDEPWLVLRLIGAIHEKPTDRFLHGSELREVCERILDDIDRRVDEFTAFDPQGGVSAGNTAATNLIRAVAEIAELEETVDLRKDGPWGGRIIKQKGLFTKKAEALLKRMEDVVNAALPVKPSKYGKGLRGAPTFERAPDPVAVARAEAMLTFLEKSRGPAQTGGFASLRAKVIERLDDRMDHYVNDVLDNLRGEEPDEPQRASEFLEIAAGLIGLYRDEKAAQIVRRRAAA